MNDDTITLKLTMEQALAVMTAVQGQSAALERLRQEMITIMSPPDSICSVYREAKLLEEVGRMIKETLNK